MSLRCVGNQLLQTIPSSLLTGVSTASLSIWVRVNSGLNVTNLNGVQLFGDSGGGLTVGLSATGKLQASWSANDGILNHTSSWSQSLVPGVNYHLAVTWRDGAQRYYLNGIQVGIDAQHGVLGKLGDLATYPFQLGSNLAGVDVSIDEPTLWVGYALTATDVGNLRDRVAAPSTISPASISLRWTLAGPDGAAATPGDAGLIDGSKSGLNLSSVIGNAPSYQSGDLAYSLLDQGCSAMVAPSGQGIVFKFHDAAINTVNLTKVVDNNELQSVTISGQPVSGHFALSSGGQTTAPIPTIAGPPIRYFQWNGTLATAGTFDLAVNISQVGNNSPNVLYEVFDGTTLLGTYTLNLTGNYGNNGGPVNPTPFADPGGLLRRDGAPLMWFPIGRYTFATTDLHVRVSCNAVFNADYIIVDNLRIGKADGTTVTRITPAFPPATLVAGGYQYSNEAKPYQVAGESANPVELACVGAGIRYLGDPVAIQVALSALSSIGPGNVSVTGDGSSINPLMVKFVGALGDAPHPMIAATDSALAVARVATGGILPSISINGGSPIQLVHDWLYYNSRAPIMPTASFFFPQSPPAVTYSVVANRDNTLSNGSDGRWDFGVGGYNGQAQATTGATPTATFNYRPVGAGQYRVSATWPPDPGFTTDTVYTIQTAPDLVCPRVTSNGATTQVVTDGIRKISTPCKLTASVDGNTGTILPVSVTVYGVDSSGKAISETLPAFTAGASGTVTGSMTFAAVTSVSIPAHAGRDVYTEVGTAGVALGTYHTNQTVAPSGAVDQGVPWQVLGTFALNGNNDGLIVTQSNGTSVRMVSDTLRFERLSPDTSIKIQPGDSVTYSTPGGWATVQTGGIAPSATNARVTNITGGGTIYPPLPTSTTMKVGFNLPDAQTEYGYYYYENLGRQADGIDVYPTVYPASSILLGITVTPQAFGGEGKNWANVPVGSYIMMWDGASNATLTSTGGTITETGTPAITGKTDNKRYYTLSGDAIHYGPDMRVFVQATGIIGSGPNYNYDFTNLRIYPADVDLTNPPKYRADFLKILTGLQSGRNLDPLRAVNGNATDFSDYQKDQSRLSKSIPVRTVHSGIAEIRQYTGTQYNLDNTRGVSFQLTSPTPHGLAHGQHVSIQNYNGPSAQLADSSGNTTTLNFNGYQFYIYYINPTQLVFQAGPVAFPGHADGFRMTNVLTNPDPASYVEMIAGNGMPVQDLVEIHNAANLDLYFNTTVCATDDCLTQLGTYLARNLKPGLKLRHEYSNETWNFGSFPYYWTSANSYAFYGASSSDNVPATCQAANHQWSVMKDAWVAAGRDGNDFRRVMGSLHAVSGYTSRIGSYCHSSGITFDELATAPYLENKPAFPRSPDDETIFAATVDRLNVAQHLDMWEVHYTYGGYEAEMTAHKDTLTGKSTDSTGAVSYQYPEFLNVDIITYEGGPDFMALVGGKRPNVPFINHAIVRHPRWYGIYLHILRVHQDAGCKVFHDFAMSGADYHDGTAWPAYNQTGQLPYTPGNPAQDAIQINTPDRVDLIQSVTGGAVKRWASMYLSQPSTTPPPPPPTNTSKPKRFIPVRRNRPTL